MQGSSSFFEQCGLRPRILTGEHLDYAGAAFIALRDDGRKEFLAEVERLATTNAGFGFTRLYGVRWCNPELTMRVKHLAASKTLRHAVVKTLL